MEAAGILNRGSLARVEVPFVSLDRLHEPMRADLHDALDRVLDTSGFILGQQVEGFEQEFARYCEVEHCVGVASGTAALTIALLALGAKAGDEVIVPAHTFIASALAVVHAGATPVLCDVERETGLIDPDSAAAAISDRTVGIMAVHLYGQPADMSPLREVADRNGLFLLEDAAQAHGAVYDGRRVGGHGNAAAFSFYPSKNLGALGDGGAICTDDPEVAARARQIRHLGQRTKGEHAVLGQNERLDGLQAAFLRLKLPHLDGWNSARRDVGARYAAALPGELARLPEDRPGGVYHLFPVRHPDRDGLAHTLGQMGVQTGVHYSPALHRHQALEGIRLGTDVAESEAWAAQELSLPMSESLTQDEVEHVIAACHRATGSQG